MFRVPSRSEVSLCLLAELAYQHEDAFHGHLPVLLLVCIIKMDASQECVQKHAQQVMPFPFSCVRSSEVSQSNEHVARTIIGLVMAMHRFP
jgi:hypothetical protein